VSKKTAIEPRLRSLESLTRSYGLAPSKANRSKAKKIAALIKGAPDDVAWYLVALIARSGIHEAHMWAVERLLGERTDVDMDYGNNLTAAALDDLLFLMTEEAA